VAVAAWRWVLQLQRCCQHTDKRCPAQHARRSHLCAAVVTTDRCRAARTRRGCLPLTASQVLLVWCWRRDGQGCLGPHTVGCAGRGAQGVC
jgi:hypothetical protein